MGNIIWAIVIAIGGLLLLKWRKWWRARTELLLLFICPNCATRFESENHKGERFYQLGYCNKCGISFRTRRRAYKQAKAAFDAKLQQAAQEARADRISKNLKQAGLL